MLQFLTADEDNIQPTRSYPPTSSLFQDIRGENSENIDSPAPSTYAHLIALTNAFPDSPATRTVESLKSTGSLGIAYTRRGKEGHLQLDGWVLHVCAVVPTEFHRNKTANPFPTGLTVWRNEGKAHDQGEQLSFQLGLKHPVTLGKSFHHSEPQFPHISKKKGKV